MKTKYVVGGVIVLLVAVAVASFGVGQFGQGRLSFKLRNSNPGNISRSAVNPYSAPVEVDTRNNIAATSPTSSVKQLTANISNLYPLGNQGAGNFNLNVCADKSLAKIQLSYKSVQGQVLDVNGDMYQYNSQGEYFVPNYISTNGLTPKKLDVEKGDTWFEGENEYSSRCVDGKEWKILVDNTKAFGEISGNAYAPLYVGNVVVDVHAYDGNGANLGFVQTKIQVPTPTKVLAY